MKALLIWSSLLAVFVQNALTITQDEDFGFDVAEDFEVEFSSNEGLKKSSWGLRDVIANVGQIFHLTVPKGAFDGKVKSYEAKTKQNNPLPHWLLFDKIGGTFWGIPTTKDVGKIDILVKAYHQAGISTNSFTLSIKEFSPVVARPDKCLPDEVNTILSLVIDQDIEAIKPKQRVVSINSIAKFLGLPYSAFTLIPQKSEAIEGSVILSGSGNIQSSSSKSASLVQVVVGCDGRLWVETAPLIHQLKRQAKEGTIFQVLHLPLIKWKIKTDKRTNLRKRRQLDEFGSGDSGDEYYDEYDNYEDYDNYSDNEDFYKDELTTTTKKPTTLRTKPSTTTTTTTQAPKTTTIRMEMVPLPTIPLTSETHGHRHHHGENIPYDFVPTVKVIPLIHQTTTTETSKSVNGKTDILKTTNKHVDIDKVPSPTVPATKNEIRTEKAKTPQIEEYLDPDQYEDEDYEDEDDLESETIIPNIILSREEHLPVHSPNLETTSQETSTHKIKPEIIDVTIEAITEEPSTTQREIMQTEKLTESTLFAAPTTIREISTKKDLMEVELTQEEIGKGLSSQEGAASETDSQEIEKGETSQETGKGETTLDVITEEGITFEEVTQKGVLLQTEYAAEKEVTSQKETTTQKETTEGESTTQRQFKLLEEETNQGIFMTDNISTTETSIVSQSTTEKVTTLQDDFTTLKQTTLRHAPSTFRPTTEYIEYGVRNFPPNVRNRLNRLAVRAGQYFSYIMPEGTFFDMEDGGDLRYEVTTADGEHLKKDSWLQFNPRTRQFYGLPLNEDVSHWEYIVKATDREGLSVNDTLSIVVQQPRTLYTVNHEFSLYIHIEKKHEFVNSIDWALKIMRALGMIYHQTNLSDITVRRIDYSSDPVVFVWTNESLPKGYCPQTEIDRLFTVLTANDEGDPSIALSRMLSPELRVKKVMYRGIGVCEPQPHTPITPPTNFSPIKRNPVDHINATVGELLLFRVPDDTFYDHEDQDLRLLKLSLLTEDRQPIPSNNWLQFDSKNKEFYGIPHNMDEGEQTYHLVCEDSGGLTASDSLVVVVRTLQKRRYNVEFTMKLETAYESFVTSASMKRKFVEKLKELFEDEDTTNIHLTSISKGSTIVSWYNKSLTTEICPREEINKLESILVNNDRTVASHVQDIMEPEFPVASIKLNLLGNCKVRTVIQPHDVVVPVDETATRDSSEEYLITFIVPAVIISTMLLLAGIAACVLYRRRRTGKMNVEEDGRTAYGNKGIPVIFQEELEEKPESGTKAPVILKDEKPPLAPPEYSKSGSVKLTDDSEPYQPPPPFTRTQDNGRQSRPKHTTPTYRKPPPYVPP